MRSYSVAQGLCSVLCGDRNGKEIQERGDIRVHMTDSLCSAAETNKTLQSNYTLIKSNFKNTLWNVPDKGQPPEWKLLLEH